MSRPSETLKGLASKVYLGVVEGVDAEASWVAKPTLTALAERFEVSLSPVRSAVDRLVADGYLLRTTTGRLEAPGSTPKPTRRERRSDVVAAASGEEVLSRLRQEMIARGIRGDGAFVREQPLADRYGVGRTALRSMMSKLAVEGLVELAPRRGWRAHSFDKEDLCDFLDVREVHESRALAIARPLLEDERLERFLALNAAPDLNPDAPLSNDLHDYWIDLCGNRYIRDFFSRDAIYYRTIFTYAAPETEAVIEMAGQHCEILRALLDKRWSQADKALRTHIRSQKPVVKKLVQKLMQG